MQVYLYPYPLYILYTYTKKKLHNCWRLLIAIFLAVLGGANSCTTSSEASLNNYPKEPYGHPSYDKKEFSNLVEDNLILNKNSAKKLKTKLKKGKEKWCKNDDIASPFSIWNTYREEFEKELNTSSFAALTQYFDEMGKLYKNPTVNEKELLTAIDKLEADVKAKKAFEEALRVRHNDPKHQVSKAYLDYEELWCFLNKQKKRSLKSILMPIHAILFQWKKIDDYPTALELWNKIEKDIPQEEIFERPGYDLNIIKEGLAIVNKLTESPCSLSFKELQETLPNGLIKLKDALDELHLKKIEEEKKSLKRYINVLRPILGIVPTTGE